MNKNNTYSVILPTLNEAGHINKLIIDISKNFKKNKFEILVIDDNSRDGTEKIVKKINLKNLTLIQRTNKKSSLVDSIQEGINKAKYKYIIWMDADYSHPPKYISNFIKINKNKNLDIIVCSRFIKSSKRYFVAQNKNPKAIDVLSVVLNKICKILLFQDFTDYTSGYICIKSKIIKKIGINGYYGDYFINLITHFKIHNTKILEIPFIEIARASGKSKTTSNKINFIIKCFFYIYSVIKNLILKLFSSKKIYIK